MRTEVNKSSYDFEVTGLHLFYKLFQALYAKTNTITVLCYALILLLKHLMFQFIYFDLCSVFIFSFNSDSH